MSSITSYILTLTCPDAHGIIAAVSQYIAAHHGNIVDSAQYSDPETNTFFLRQRIDLPSHKYSQFCENLTLPVPIKQLDLQPAARKKRCVLLASQSRHCVQEILFQAQLNSLPLEVVAIISNHQTNQALAEFYSIPFHYIPVAGDKAAQEQAVLDQIAAYTPDLVALARYMQILSPAACDALTGRAINIHHSFLPSFKGADPYGQAYKRGVKVIGATAHFVTPDLDEGPIIDQETTHVTHQHTAKDMRQLGRHLESLVLARALKNMAEGRVFVNGQKTVVFAA